MHASAAAAQCPASLFPCLSSCAACLPVLLELCSHLHSMRRCMLCCLCCCSLRFCAVLRARHEVESDLRDNVCSQARSAALSASSAHPDSRTHLNRPPLPAAA